MKRNAQLTAPSPRLPLGRLRESPAKTGVNALMSATGYGEGRGEGTSPQAQTRGEAPSPAPTFPPPFAGEGRVGATSPRKRGEVKKPSQFHRNAF
jgi:hypothetical protein